MRVIGLAVLVCAGAAQAQFLVNPAQLTPSMANFDRAPDEVRMKCTVTPARPTLNFSFRFQAGFRVSVPLEPYVGSPHVFAQLVRVTPAGAGPSYLSARMRMPKVPPTKAN